LGALIECEYVAEKPLTISMTSGIVTGGFMAELSTPSSLTISGGVMHVELAGVTSARGTSSAGIQNNISLAASEMSGVVGGTIDTLSISGGFSGQVSATGPANGAVTISGGAQDVFVGSCNRLTVTAGSGRVEARVANTVTVSGSTNSGWDMTLIHTGSLAITQFLNLSVTDHGLYRILREGTGPPSGRPLTIAAGADRNIIFIPGNALWPTPFAVAHDSGSNNLVITENAVFSNAAELYIPRQFLDAKGDLITATADNTPAILTVGSNDQVLVADSAQATGLKWAAVPAPSFLSISRWGTD
jgi:hypothetical protein